MVAHWAVEWTGQRWVGDREVGHLFKQFNVGDIMSLRGSTDEDIITTAANNDRYGHPVASWDERKGTP